MANGGVQITFVDKGRVTKLAESSETCDLVAACEEALMSSTNVTRLGVSEATISGIKKADASIEISYPKAREFTILAFNRKLIIDRILIPVSGDYAETTDKKKFVVVFYGNGRYEHGPYSNSAAFYDRIARALYKAGISF